MRCPSQLCRLLHISSLHVRHPLPVSRYSLEAQLEPAGGGIGSSRDLGCSAMRHLDIQTTKHPLSTRPPQASPRLSGLHVARLAISASLLGNPRRITWMPHDKPDTDHMIGLVLHRLKHEFVSHCTIRSSWLWELLATKIGMLDATVAADSAPMLLSKLQHPELLAVKCAMYIPSGLYCAGSCACRLCRAPGVPASSGFLRPVWPSPHDLREHLAVRWKGSSSCTAC